MVVVLINVVVPRDARSPRKVENKVEQGYGECVRNKFTDVIKKIKMFWGIITIAIQILV